jgi:hypothetical protein
MCVCVRVLADRVECTSAHLAGGQRWPGQIFVCVLICMCVCVCLQTVLNARRRIWLVDNAGLVTRERGDSGTLETYKLPFTHSGECIKAAAARPP